MNKLNNNIKNKLPVKLNINIFLSVNNETIVVSGITATYIFQNHPISFSLEELIK
jgi:hypothetical protein